MISFATISIIMSSLPTGLALPKRLREGEQAVLSIVNSLADQNQDILLSVSQPVVCQAGVYDEDLVVGRDIISDLKQ